MLRGRHSSHQLHVLGGLFLQDVDGVVNGDDAHQTVLLVHHRQGGVIVTGKEVCHFFPVIQGGDRDNIGLHHVPKDGVGRGQQHLTHRNRTQQLAGGADDIAGVDGLLVHAVLADVVKGFPHGHAGAEIHKLDGHQRAGTLFGIGQHLVDGLAGITVHVFQDPLDHAGRHLFDHVHRVVQKHLFQHLGKLLVGKAQNELLLQIGIHFGKGVGSLLLGQQAEQTQQILVFQITVVQQVGHALGNVCRVEGLQIFLQVLILLFLQKCENFLRKIKVCHGFRSSNRIFWGRIGSATSAITASAEKHRRRGRVLLPFLSVRPFAAGTSGVHGVHLTI